jgi:hypothetical protein
MGADQQGTGGVDTLERLRQSGALSDAEFETLKNKIMRED